MIFRRYVYDVLVHGMYEYAERLIHVVCALGVVARRHFTRRDRRDFGLKKRDETRRLARHPTQNWLTKFYNFNHAQIKNGFFKEKKTIYLPNNYNIVSYFTAILF